MTPLLVSTVFALGLLLLYDGLVRPEARPDPMARLRRLGPMGAGGAAGAAVALVATGWPVAVIGGAAIGASVPRMLLRSREEKAKLARREALAEICARLRDAIRSGIGLSDALAHAASSAPAAVAGDLRKLVSESRVSGISEAGASFAQRVGDPSAELFASALSLADRLGSRNLTDVLDSLADATTAQAAAIREARARQTRARMSARIVAVVPMLLLLAIRRANPAYLEPFSTPTGQFVLAFAFLLVWAGYVSMKRAARIEGGGR
jgi:Flp pilus assembly protein TadB